MKVIIDIDENCIENQVIIKCSKFDENIAMLQRNISNSLSENIKLELHKDQKDYYIDIEDILFFQTEGDMVKAHTRDDIFDTGYRLYELEKILPWTYCRISKSAILNVKKVYAITKNITASSEIEFKDSHKHVFVSRGYFKPLKSKLDEIRSKE